MPNKRGCLFCCAHGRALTPLWCFCTLPSFPTTTLLPAGLVHPCVLVPSWGVLQLLYTTLKSAWLYGQRCTSHSSCVRLLPIFLSSCWFSGFFWFYFLFPSKLFVHEDQVYGDKRHATTVILWLSAQWDAWLKLMERCPTLVVEGENSRDHGARIPVCQYRLVCGGWAIEMRPLWSQVVLRSVLCGVPKRGLRKDPWWMRCPNPITCLTCLVSCQCVEHCLLDELLVNTDGICSLGRSGFSSLSTWRWESWCTTADALSVVA